MSIKNLVSRVNFKKIQNTCRRKITNSTRFALRSVCYSPSKNPSSADVIPDALSLKNDSCTGVGYFTSVYNVFI